MYDVLMNSRPPSLFTLGFGLIAVVLWGCGHTVTGADGSKVTVEPGGKIESTDAKGDKATITENGQNIKVETKDGTATYSTAKDGTTNLRDSKGNSMETGVAFSETDLGVPFYPGSTDTKSSMKVVNADGQNYTSVRTTTDAPEKVIAFYTDKLGKPKSSAMSGESSMASWTEGKRSELLLVMKEDAQYRISMTVVTKK